MQRSCTAKDAVQDDRVWSYSAIGLRIRWWWQLIAMVDALYRFDFDVGLLVSGEVEVGADQKRLRAVRDVKAAMEAHGLDAAFFAAGLVESVGERDGFIVDLVR